MIFGPRNKMDPKMKMDALIIQTFLVVVFSVTTSSTFSQEQDPGHQFLRFRGSYGNGVVADDTRLPETWDTQTNVKWKMEVPGWGWSSPIVVGQKVFVTSVINQQNSELPKAGLYLGRGRKDPPQGVHRWMVYCFNFSNGKKIWEKEVHNGQPKFPRHPKSTYASETPTSDGERLYVLFGDLGLYCLDLDGKEVWQKKITPRETMWGYGAAASPIVHENQVIMVYDNQEASYIASYDAKTGDQNWKTERDETSTWATPFLWKNPLRSEIVVCGKKKNRSYDLMGNLLWEFDGRMSSLVIPSPLAANGLLYITSGYFQDRRKPVYAIRPGGKGDLTLLEDEKSNDYIQWYLPMAGPYNTSPIVYKNYYYTLLDRGFLTLHDARTGEEIYGRQRFRRSMTFTSSPWAYNDRVFFLDEKGRTVVIKVGEKYEEVGVNDLSELCCATPSIADGNLLIRTATQIYCITKMK